MSETFRLGPGDYAFVQELLREQTGFVLEPAKEYLLETRLGPVAERLGFETVARLLAHLRAASAPSLQRTAVEALVNGETTFFRDAACFDGLAATVLPRLLEQRAADCQLNVWCAGCSTGQEPYSLAMLLQEDFPQLAHWSVRLLATDVSRAHLERARAGRYAQFEVNRGLPAALLVKYFDQDGTEWTLCDALRRQVAFEELNLVQPWPALPPMDLVLMRNVMIYWSVETRREVLARVRRVLAPGGVLVLGAAETTWGVDEAFDRLGPSCCFALRGPGTTA